MNGTTLRALRMALGYTQQEAALLIGGVQLRSWQYWESPGREIPADVENTIRELCHWKTKAVQAALEQIKEIRATHGENPEAVTLTYYSNETARAKVHPDDPLLWRPHCMAMAEIAAQDPAVQLIQAGKDAKRAAPEKSQAFQPRRRSGAGNVYPIPEALHEKYHGAGHALAAVLDGKVVELAYLRDLLEDYDDSESSLSAAVTDDRLGPTIRYLQSLGDVSIGMCSSYEFVEL